MIDENADVSMKALNAVIANIIQHILTTSLSDATPRAGGFEARYKNYQAQARALSLMIKAENDLKQRHKNQADAAKEENFIAYENLPPLSQEGLEALEKRFAHLAYKTEIGLEIPALPSPPERD